MSFTPQSDNLHPILTHWIAGIKAHEKLLIIILGAVLAFHFYGDVLNYMTGRDKRQVDAQLQITQTAAQKSQADSQVNLQLQQQLADLKLQLATISARSQANIQKRTQDTQTQKKVNDTSSSVQVASRFLELLRVQPQEITVNTDETLTFTPQAAHTNLDALEDGAQAQADVLDLNKQLSACTAVSTKQDETITGIRQELSDEKTSHQADVKLERANTQLAKDEGKKSFRRGFKFGAIIGFIGGLFVGHHI